MGLEEAQPDNLPSRAFSWSCAHPLTSGGSILSTPYNWIHRTGQSRSCPRVATYAAHQTAWELKTRLCYGDTMLIGEDENPSEDTEYALTHLPMRV